MTRTRIAFVIPTLAPGGTERQLLYLVKGLTNDRDVRVMCTGRAGPWAGRLPESCTITALGCRGGWDVRLQSRAYSVLSEQRPDVVHSFLFGFDYAVNVAARRANVPVVISSRRQLATWKRGRHIRLQRRANALVDAIVANAQAVADFARSQEQAPIEKYHVIPNGIDVDRFTVPDSPEMVRSELGIPSDAPLLGMVANFSPVKNHAFFVRVAASLAHVYPELHFLLVGDGPLRAGIERRMTGAGLGARMRFIHNCDDAARSYRAMTVSMLCSKIEGFPNVALESMAAGVPFVGPAVGGIVEAIPDREFGLLVEGSDVTSFHTAIASLLNDAEKRASIAECARARVQRHYTIEAMVQRYAGLYTDLLAMKRAEAA